MPVGQTTARHPNPGRCGQRGQGGGEADSTPPRWLDNPQPTLFCHSLCLLKEVPWSARQPPLQCTSALLSGYMEESRGPRRWRCSRRRETQPRDASARPSALAR
ncbi:hypothetical protein TcCL_Unassigned04191 [Trypanosoma cruzi]|nr:hypothetical protein TcCL_Unassigned04191 [Trypanosoma cruzi]